MKKTIEKVINVLLIGSMTFSGLVGCNNSKYVLPEFYKETVSEDEYNTDLLVIIEGSWGGLGPEPFSIEKKVGINDLKVGDIAYETDDSRDVRFEVLDLAPDYITLRVYGSLYDTTNKVDFKSDDEYSVTIKTGESVEFHTKTLDSGESYKLIYNGEYLDYTDGEIDETEGDTTETKEADVEDIVFKKFNEADLNSAPFAVFEHVMTFGPIEDEGKYDNLHKYDTLSVGDILYDKYGATVEVMDVSSDAVVLSIEGFEHNNMENITEVNLHKGETIELRTDTMDSSAILTIRYNGGIS